MPRSRSSAPLIVRLLPLLVVAGVVWLWSSYLRFRADEVGDYSTITGTLARAEEHVGSKSGYLDLHLRENTLRYRVPSDGYLDDFDRKAFFAEVKPGAAVQLAALTSEIARPRTVLFDDTPTIFVHGVRVGTRAYLTVEDRIAWQNREHRWTLGLAVAGTAYLLLRVAWGPRKKETLHDRYFRTVRQLPPARQLAFACACAEHVLPFLEKIVPTTVPREVLDQVWRSLEQPAAGGLPEPAAMAERARALQPEMDDDADHTPENHIVGQTCELVASCVELAAGAPDAAVNAVVAGGWAMDILMVVESRGSAEDGFFGDEIFLALESGKPVPRSVQEEWQALNGLLAVLGAPEEPDWSAFRVEQRGRGARLAGMYEEGKRET